MAEVVPNAGQTCKPVPYGLSAIDTLIMAGWFGLIGGFLNVGALVLAKHVLHAVPYYRLSHHFGWTIPTCGVMLMMVPGLLIAAVNQMRVGFISAGAAAWIFGSFAIWAPLLDLPISGTAGLMFAVGLARLVSRSVARLGHVGRRRGRRSVLVMVAVTLATALVTAGGRAVSEARAVAALADPPAGAGNVLLIVMDTVRAANLGFYGYHRETTPELTRWAKRGVRFDFAQAPAPWTFPSHCSVFTGRWPHEIDSHRHLVLDTPSTTLAEFLAGHGYQTAGFAANTSYCSYESGLNRGFAHYEDYPLSFWTVLASTAPGRWIAMNVLMNLVHRDDFYPRKWLQFQSRDAEEIGRAFRGWLDGRRTDKPFFAFLNYIDAHEPFLTPRGSSATFGVQPESRSDHEMLLNYWYIDKTSLSPRDVAMNRDGYDRCITYLDHQLGALLADFERRGLMRDTTVIITSDHGEEFGEHQVFNHGFGLYLGATHVPLLIISPVAARGKTVLEPVSLCDIPATVVDLLGLSAGSPFPGKSLAVHWRGEPGNVAAVSRPAFAEADLPNAPLDPRRGRGPTQRGYSVSLLTRGWHYIRDGSGAEALFDLANDSVEASNAFTDDLHRAGSPDRFRRAVLSVLKDTGWTGSVVPDYLKRIRRALAARLEASAIANDAAPSSP
jgi:arylsulfatase A-like enzyme